MKLLPMPVMGPRAFARIGPKTKPTSFSGLGESNETKATTVNWASFLKSLLNAFKIYL